MKTSIRVIVSLAMAAVIVLIFQTGVLAQADGDTLSVSDGFGLPGETGKVTILLENQTAVKGLYFIIEDQPDVLTLPQNKAIVKNRASNHAVHYVNEDDTVKVLLIPTANPANTIAEGLGDILELEFDVHNDATLGTTVTLSITGEQVADNNNDTIPVGTYEGTFWIGIKGDVDASSTVDLFDVLRMIDIALSRPPAPTPYEQWAGDFDDDGDVDVLDINQAIDIALGTLLLLANNDPEREAEAAGVVNLNLLSPVRTPEGNLEVPVTIRSSNPLAGVQMSIKFDSESFNVKAPKIAEMTAHMNVSTKVVGDEIHLMVCSLDGHSIPSGEGVLFTIPLQSVSAHTKEFELSLNAAKAAGEGGYKLETLLNKDGDGAHIVPDTYALWPNSPNPFNAGTTITYEIPKVGAGEVSVQLQIYNIHGQLVRSLVDAKRSAGRYSLVWDGRDNQGLAVSTGVYFYQLVAGQTVLHKKMALLR